MPRFCALSVVLLIARSTFGVALHQVDTFSTGAQGWTSWGTQTVPLGGGPGGAQDRYLRLASDGQSALVAQNDIQWAGSYTTFGVTSIQADFANMGSTPLEIRLVIDGVNRGRYTSTVPLLLPADGLWHKGVFGLHQADLTAIIPSQSLPVILGSANRIWFHHQPGAVADVRVPVAGILGIDNIRALPEPGMLGLAAGAVLCGCGRRRRGGA